MRTSASVWAFVAVSLLIAATAKADPAAGITASPSALTDEELDRRIEWLTIRLDDAAGHAKLWQYGWSSSYALGIGIGAAQAAATHSGDTRVNGIVTASKAVLGTARLLLTKHPARLGADPMRQLAGNDRASKLRQLVVGESQLQKIAERAKHRHRWQRHTGNVVVNLIGAAIIAGVGDATDAAISAAVGIAVGELMIFTSPGRAESDLSDYRQRIAARAPRTQWQISLAGTANGVAIRIDF